MLSTTRDGFRRARTFARSCRWLHTAAVLIAVGVMGLFAGIGEAGQERYDYDPIGRLIRFTDSNNEVTEYTYDKAGNILSVVRGAPGSNLPPALSSVTPSVVRVGNTATLTLTGERLQVGTLQASDPGLDLVNVRQAATQVLADLTVSPSVPTGGHTLTFTNGQGTARIALTIAPKLPTISVEPSPLALPPDNTSRSITLRLSHPDVVAHQVAISSSDTARMTVSPATISFAAGQTTAQVSVTPKTSGFVNLSIGSATLKSTAAPVFITSDFRGVNTSHAAPLGVRVGDVVEPSAPSTTTTFKVNGVGVVVGPVLTSVSPRGVAAGGTYTFSILGAAIPPEAQISMLRAEGVTVTSVTSTPDRITAVVAIDGAAVAGQRRFVVKDGAGNVVPFADAAAATIHLTTGQPEIISVEPLHTTTGKIMQLKVRGAHMQNAQVRILPAVDVAVDNSPSINADGTELNVRISISPLAARGSRTVQIVTPSGDSGTSPTAANQLTFVSEIRESVTPIFAQPLGVQVGVTPSTGSGTTTFGPLGGGAVGLVVGAAAYEASPKVAVVGESTTLLVQGTGLQTVTQAVVQPADGITHGAFTVNAEGTALSLPLAIDAAAARGMRRVVLTTAAGRLVFTVPSGDQVLVATPAPELTWVKPQVVEAGKTVAMTVLGRNFNDVTGVSFDPAAGLSVVGAITASPDGTTLGFSVQVAAGAQSGQRTLLVGTAGGTSSAVPAPSNTFQVAQQVGPTVSPVFAPPVGVMVGTPAPVTEALGLHAPNLGILVTEQPVEQTQERGVFAGNVGVLVGAATTGLSPRRPDGLLKGTTGTLTVTGYALDEVTAVTITGKPGLTVGAFQAGAGGTQLSVPVTVAADAASDYYGINLVKGSGTTALRITPLNEAEMFFQAGSLPTAILSVAPIVVEQGKTYTFTVRGTNVRDVFRLLSDPATGLVFGDAGEAPLFSTDEFGEKLTIKLRVQGDAAVGVRVIRLQVPGGVTSAEPVPANSITVVTPQ